jgi:predicted phosphate transport protein (TIGR00153 family)
MKAESVLKFLMPKAERFHELLARDTQNLREAARVFSEIAHSGSLEDRRIKVVQLKAIEHAGDEITRSIFEALNSSFITPFDREDIRGLTMDLDDILDYLEGVAQYLVIFELAETPEPLRRFAEILTTMVAEVDKGTTLIWDMKNERQIHECIMRISELENQADALYNTVIASLFKDKDRNPIEVLKWTKVYDGLEDACDACKDFTHVLGNVVVKNA